MQNTNPVERKITTKNFWKKGKLLFTDIRKFGGQKQFSDELAEEKFGEDADVLKGIMDLMLPEDRDLIIAYQQIKNEFLSYLSPPRSMPHSLPVGRYILNEIKEDVEEKFKDCQKRAFEIRDLFCATWEDREKRFAKAKPKLYDPAKYPRKEDIKNRFHFNMRWVDSIEQNEEELKEDLRQMKSYATLAIKKSTLDRMEALGRDNITQATLDSIENQIFSKYDRLFAGFIDDVNIPEAIADLKEYLEGTDAEMLRSDDDFKAMVQQKAKEVTKKINAVKVDKGDRSLVF